MGRDFPAGATERKSKAMKMPRTPSEQAQVVLHELMMIQAELRVPLATVRLGRYTVGEYDRVFEVNDAHGLDLSLRPRPRDGRACYPERWRSNRFEPLGDVMFVPAREVIRVTGSPACQSSIMCQLHAEPIRTLFEDDFALADRDLDESLDISSPTIRSLILRLGAEARNPGFASAMLAEQIVGQLVIELFRYPGAGGGPASGGLAPWRLRTIDDRLAEHAAPTLVELARLCRLSVRQLTRGFRASRGCSIGEYVTRNQIEHAKRLLNTGESIKVIAESLGFASSSSFTYAFRRATGQTPGQFRENESA